MGTNTHLHTERTREREFYKYYNPLQELSDAEPTRLDLQDAEALERHVPRAGPNLALTAFCQLGALRLAARRSLLFFFDRKDAFVLAEATRTLSLLDHEVHQDPEDALWLGHTIAPRGLTICEHAMNVPASNTGSNSSDSSAGEMLIINDLKESSLFCDRPFVTGGPKARFYAGVPLTTPTGVRIGVYAVMDDEPRDGLSDVEKDFMKEMATMTMSHLGMIHAQAELGRQSRMLAGLGTFVQKGPPPAPRPKLADSSTHSSESATGRPKSAPGVPLGSRSDAKWRERRSHEDLRNTDVYDYVSESEQDKPDRRSVVQAQRRLDTQLDKDPATGAKNTLQRAADLIQRAIDADGVLFLDAAPNGPEGTGSCQGSGTETGTTVSDVGSDDSLEKAKNDTCRRLGSSARKGDAQEQATIPMSSKFLKGLLRKYPEGKIWTFNSEGEVSSTESSSSDDGSTRKGDIVPASKGRTSNRNRKSGEAAEMLRLFPGARAVCVVGMWDPVRHRWFAGGIMWTHSPLRVFSQEGELAYMIAFCDVVMAKLARLEAKSTDRAKTDFIESVSHELRSPLHGIVGSLELLHDREDNGDRALIAQMEKCTSTLTDVIDHLLDFAKINHHVSRPKMRRRQLKLLERQPSVDSVTRSTASEQGAHSLARLTEEVADATYYSHCCGTSEEASSKVDFALDISPTADFHVCDMVGAWKRLCVNLIGNALKFTRSGHVAVSLKSLSRKRKRPVAILTVDDTGCGMSPEFIDSGIFRAFSQENQLTPGTGLGLSVVAKLVKGLGGKIDVQSKKGIGTTVTVMIPIDALPRDETIEEQHEGQDSVPVGILRPISSGDDNDDDNKVNGGRSLQVLGVQNACRRAGALLTSSENAIVNMVFEDDIPLLTEADQLSGHPDGAHLIVLCRDPIGTYGRQKLRRPLANVSHIEFVPQPFGPDRISAAIANCLLAPPHSEAGDPIANATSTDLSDVALVEAQTDNEESPPTTLTLRVDEKGPLLINTKEVEASSSEQPSTPEPPGSPTSHKLSLLLVDDNPLNLRLLTTYADKNKHPRLAATNGQEAVEAYKAAASIPSDRARPEVVFLDINMPVLDGFQAARQIRAFEKEAQVSPTILIALTCLGSEAAKQEAVACGFDMFLTKPVRPRDLTKILKTVEEENGNGSASDV
ncbi:Sensor protein EvgS [Cercospora beticola]|uniref:histidine kinase n=1 Tax=Cercospora beticola TaxID=122368 RepID=A0A2G5H7X9_CERBT|nr:Sensor protein EvgS [Cercospora beticola]PIA88637.1 Sensor protein EvgS [Cercospora beticola]WPB03056.1 hypothetical protein RHO25_007693 [Cercospora beticola]CAK1358240.1 unnamed protein product [Cercospora beticola]